MSTRPGLLGPALVHLLTLLLVATLLLLRAQPVNWDTPTNLAYQEVWASLVTVIRAFAGLAGSVEGVLWAPGARTGATVACLVSAAYRRRRPGGDRGSRAGRHVPARVGGVLSRPDAGHGRLAAAARHVGSTHESRSDVMSERLWCSEG